MNDKEIIKLVIEGLEKLNQEFKSNSLDFEIARLQLLLKL